MQKLTRHQLLEYVHTVASEQDWERLGQELQQLLSDESLSDTIADPSARVELLNLTMQVLEFGDFRDRWEVAKVFPSFGVDAIAPLIGLLDDEDADPESQWFAVRILGGFDHPRVVEALIEVLKTSQSEDLSSMAISVLANLKDTVSALEPLLKIEATRLWAIQALGRIRRSETIPLLMQVVHDPDAQIRAIAIEALSSFHSDEITSVLIAALKDLAVQVRIAAISGLGFRQDQAAIDFTLYLKPLLRDLNLDVCRQAAIALGRLGTAQSVTTLYEALESPYTPEPLALEIVRAFGWIALPDALDRLESALLKLSLSESVQLEIVQALGRVDASAKRSPSIKLKPQAAEILLNALPSIQSSNIRQAIALSLGQLGDLSAMNALVKLLSDPEDGVRFHAIAGLKTLDSEAAYQCLEQFAKVESEHSALGQGIAIALREWNY